MDIDYTDRTSKLRTFETYRYRIVLILFQIRPAYNNNITIYKAHNVRKKLNLLFQIRPA